MQAELRLLLLAGISVGCALGQRNGGQTGAPSDNPGATNNFTVPKSPYTSVSPAPIIVTGSVKMDDGSPVPSSVKIQVVCNGSERTVTRTTPMNDFIFQWSAAPTMGQTSGGGSAFTEFGAAIDAGSRFDRTEENLPQSCDLRAESGGYGSTEINLNNRFGFDGSDVGIIFLHRLAQGETGMVSVSTLQAPKDARKNFDKGTELLRQGKVAEAAKSFERAVAIYPGYAEAWLSLGRIQFTTGSRDAAQGSAQRAMDLDSKLVGAWQVLGYIASDKQDWREAAHYLDEAVRMDPTGSALPWFFSALAHYNLRGYDEAERCIRAEIKLDPQFRIRRAQFLLALILIARQDTVGGVAVLHNYLAASPDPRDVKNANDILSRLQPPYAALP